MAPGFLDLQHQPGVEDVLGGHAIVHVLPPATLAQPRQGADGRHQQVPCLQAFAAQLGEVEALHLGGAVDLPRRLVGDDAHLGLGRRQGSLDIQPPPHLVGIGKDRGECRGRVGAPVYTGFRNVTWHFRVLALSRWKSLDALHLFPDRVVIGPFHTEVLR